jgi:prepilin-type N-terminal cleavage/methylation domain-containing protein
MKNRRREGFTLIELLAVLLILSILVTALLIGMGDALRGAKRETTKQRLSELGGVITQYQNDNGACPPSSFRPDQEVSNDGTNVGIEALVVALFSKKYEAGGLLKDVRDKLVNLDGDSSPRQLTDFETRALLEIPDEWGNPIAYIERTDYALQNRRYLTVDTETGETAESTPVAYKNAQTGQYYAPLSFQLISAGPDGRFGTEDDITPFEHE